MSALWSQDKEPKLRLDETTKGDGSVGHPLIVRLRTVVHPKNADNNLSTVGEVESGDQDSNFFRSCQGRTARSDSIFFQTQLTKPSIPQD
ncbi:hypothetical protein PROFUN_09991 [Planoprotostelium fungivorum]|uniref:Uncharacterized protein n=1 Tax=Planoprotostelium fungivorum TaxID=1890364 RepID=A0A2P6NFI9_9EUKA|nr:hypothetical protein PROFUN_09991 [Planoprotostelium fungivorum]